MIYDHQTGLTTPDPILDREGITRRGFRRLVFGAGAALLVVAATGSWAIHNSRDANAAREFEAAKTALAEDLLRFELALSDGREVVEASSDHVLEADTTKRDVLVNVIATGVTDRDAVSASIAATTDRTTISTLSRDGSISIRRHTDEISSATTALKDAIAAWHFEDARSALTRAIADLDHALERGADLLSASDGQVTDNSVREQLSAVLSSAAAERDAALDPTSASASTTTTAALAGWTERVSQQAIAVTTATNALELAHTSWLEEQGLSEAVGPTDSGAGVNPPREGSSEGKPSGKASGAGPATGSGTASGAGPSSDAGGSSSTAPPPDSSDSGADDDGTWVDTSEPGELCFAGDTSGNAWEC